jgi:hypothetical protein
VTVSAIKSATLHVAPASFCGYIFRAAGGFSFSASGGCRFVKNSRLRTVCFKRLLIPKEYIRRTSYAFTARMLRKNITPEMSGKKSGLTEAFHFRTRSFFCPLH